jgi:uncharacterized protein (TIGR02145 family)
MKKAIIISLLILSGMIVTAQNMTVTDIEGNVYTTVTIGSQTWMVENLKTSRYRNGDMIPNVIDLNEWAALTTGALCNYDNDEKLGNKYGKLYNWYAINDSRNLAPVGWHVATDEEWLTLYTYVINNLNGSLSLGKALAANSDWKTAADVTAVGNDLTKNNSTGFSALPSGFRYGNGYFGGIAGYNSWWTSTPGGSYGPWQRGMRSYDGALSRSSDSEKSGNSVRCIMNSSTSTENLYNQEKIKLFPNPVKDRISIECAGKKDLKMKIFNIAGDCIFQSNLKNEPNSIDLSSLTKGIYFIQFTDSNHTIQKKLIKE